MQIIKYTFDVPVVAMVSHIPAKSRMAVNYVKRQQQGDHYNSRRMGQSGGSTLGTQHAEKHTFVSRVGGSNKRQRGESISQSRIRGLSGCRHSNSSRVRAHAPSKR